METPVHSTLEQNGLLRITRNSKLTSIAAWLLALSFAGGADLMPVIIGGATFSLFRMVVVLIAVVGVLDLIVVRTIASPWVKGLFAFLFIWLCYALLPISAIVDRSAWQKDFFYLVMGLFTCVAIYHVLLCGRRRELLQGAMAGLGVNLLLALVQMATTIQPESAHAAELILYSSEHFVRLAPVGLFGNPNHFAFYLCMHLLLLVHFRSSMRRDVFAVAYSVIAILLLLTASKIALVVFALVTLLLAFNLRSQLTEWWSQYRAPLIGAFALLVALVLSIEWMNTRELALAHERELGITKTVKPQSSATRAAMWTCGIEAMQSTHGLGLGAGQFTPFLREGRCSAETSGVSNAHSGAIEIGAQYGVGILLLFALLYGYLIVVTWGTSAAPWMWCYLIALALLQMANSSFLASPVSWVMLALPMFVLFDAKPKVA